MLKHLLIFSLLLLTGLAFRTEAAPDRRKDQFGKEFGYYVYPILGEIPGLGKAAGGGASVLNIGGNDADFTGYFFAGDFDAKGVALLDHHIMPQRLVLDVGYNDYRVAPIAYGRGINSDPNDVIYPEVEGRYVLGQLTLTFDERRYELFTRLMFERNRLQQLLDRDGIAFAGVDTKWNSRRPIALGGTIDFTDDRLDPRLGARLELSAKLPTDNEADESEYYVTDYNLTGYIPLRNWDTLVLNLYHSRAIVSREGESDFSTLQQTSGLNCGQYPPSSQHDSCITTESKHIDRLIANNRYGTASSLGGTQRLRSFDNYRFYAAQALSYGMEYRWNLTDEYTPFDVFFAKGVRTGIQVAAFWERGMVADHYNELFDDGRSSYGVGFRLILSGVIIRFDYADGDEGRQSQLFVTYPWSVYSVDSPG